MRVDEYIMILATLPQDMEVMGIVDEFVECVTAPAPKIEKVVLGNGFREAPMWKPEGCCIDQLLDEKHVVIVF